MHRSLVSYICVLTAVLAVLSSAVRASDAVIDPDVTVLSDSNFKDFINQDISLVEFYAPWCGHCKSLAPEYATAATQLKSGSDPIPLGKVDCTVETGISNEFGITGYPTLKVFRNGKPTDYQGQRKAADIVSYMKKQSGPASKPITSAKDLENVIKSDPNSNYAVIGFFDSSKTTQLASAFTVIANKLRDNYVFGKVNDKFDLGKKYGVKDGEEAIVAVLQDEHFVFDGKVSSDALEKFVADKSVPLVGVYGQATADMYRQKGLPVAKLFVKFDTQGISGKNAKYYINRLKKLAQGNDAISFAIADKGANAREIDNYSGADKDFVFVIDDVTTQKQYNMPTKKGGKFDIKAVESFVKQFTSGELKPHVKSETAPDNNLELPVKILTGQNFEEIVTDDVNALVEFYAPWCGHCKSLAPKYDELGEKMSDDNSVVIGKLDATANDWPNKSAYEVSGYPTLYFKPAGGAPMKYDGAREVKDMHQFIKKNSKSTKNEL